MCELGSFYTFTQHGHNLPLDTSHQESKIILGEGPRSQFAQLNFFEEKEHLSSFEQ